MRELVQEKNKAVLLRKKGYSYNEILKRVPVAKSTLSLWLKDLPLTKYEKEVLRKRKHSNISRGRIKAAAAHRRNRIARDKEVALVAQKEFNQHKNDPLFHTGISLYWAEGAKRSDMFQFTNSDYKMIEIMLQWLEEFTNYNRCDLGYRLYIHKPYAHENLEEWWQQKLNVDALMFKKTTYKPTQLGIKKRPDYKGCIRLEVPKSTSLLRKMKCWINLLVDHYQKE